MDLPSEEEADDWLAPIFLDERAAAYVGPESTSSASDAGDRTPLCNPIGAARISNKGFLPMTREKYLSLLDSLGRMVRQGKRGFIPADLPPILERLNVEPQTWFDSILDLFGISPNPRPSPTTVAAG